MATRPSEKTLKLLFAASGNRCAFPRCDVTLVDLDTDIVHGQICHIRAQSAGGPRYDPAQSDEHRHGFANLVLMCPAHHKVIDDHPGEWPVERLIEIKAAHEARHADGPEPSDAMAARWLTYTPPPLPDPDTLPEPGTLPPGFRIPFDRNPLFTGRREPLLALARDLLHEAQPSALPQAQAIAGMGGVGKTQLAVEFAYRYGRYLHGVHWLNARDPAALEAEVAACGAAMALPRWPETQPRVQSFDQARAGNEFKSSGASMDFSISSAW